MDLPPSPKSKSSMPPAASSIWFVRRFIFPWYFDLKAGAYFIRIRVGNQAVVRKVL